MTWEANTPRRNAIMVLVFLAVLLTGVWLSLPKSNGDGGQVIEGCHWDGSAWVYQDGSLCRGTGEGPTVNGDGTPACADLTTAIYIGGGRIKCIDRSVQQSD